MTAEISLTLLGAFQVTQQHTEMTAFNSDKTRALLAYLAVEADYPHRRESLIGLFWPESTEARARANLSQALHVLRKLFEPVMIAPPLILADAKQLRLNPDATLWIDARTFTTFVTGCPDHQPARQHHCAHCQHTVTEAIDLYKGELLTGFSLPTCPEFEQWLLVKRAELHRLAADALAWLTTRAEQQGQWARARVYAQRWVALESLAEEPQHALVRILSATGHRHEALAHLATYEQLLTTELGVALSETLRQLQRQLTTGDVNTTEPTPLPIQLVVTPPFLTTAAPGPPVAPVFVGRAEEVAHLQHEVRRMLTGVGRCLFVTGEAGFGKSALLHQVAGLAQQAYPAVVVVRGNCNAHTGLGDPYLPFREILAALTGDLEAHWRAGLLSQVAVMQLWALLPMTIDALLENGADLIGTLAPIDALLTRTAETVSIEQLERLRTVAVRNSQRAAGNPLVQQQSALFSQYTAALQRLAQHAPLLLLIDDLQWADLGTISLLFHLARTIAHDRILILGAYRPSEVALGRNGQRHPLEAVLHELQRHYGAMTVALEAADSRGFVDQVVDLEPNALTATFREQLWCYTDGNALFTLELLRGLQERGDLCRDDMGRWIANLTLNWERLPPRVEAVIGERIGRLSPALQALLMTASVEGEVFTAEVVAQVQQMARRDTVHYLSHELDRQHHLVTLHSVQHLGEQPITHYRFRHILFQKYLYSRLDEAERVYAHADVGVALETLYAGQSVAMESVDGALARHFEVAGQFLKAAHYLLGIGQRALRLSALEEAITHCTNGIKLVQRSEQTTAQIQLELQLHLTVGSLLIQNRGYNRPEVAQCYKRAEELCRVVGDVLQRFTVLRGLTRYYTMGSQLNLAQMVACQLVELAEQQANAFMQAEAYANVGSILYWLGDFAAAHGHLKRGVEQATVVQMDQQWRDYSQEWYGQNSLVFGLAYLAFSQWALGYPDRALETSYRAITLARQLDHPNSLAFALFFAGHVHILRREPAKLQRVVDELDQLVMTHKLAFWGTGVYRNWILIEQDGLATGMANLRTRFSDDPSQWRCHNVVWPLIIFALGLMKVGECDTAQAAVREAVSYAAAINEYSWEPELHRLYGKVLLMRHEGATQTIIAEAETSFRRAIAIAQKRGAKSWELRATTSLAKLLHDQKRSSEAHSLLAPIYHWFTEGFDTMDLRKAKQLLEALQ